jgi:hypothetical protein
VEELLPSRTDRQRERDRVTERKREREKEGKEHGAARVYESSQIRRQ